MGILQKSPRALQYRGASSDAGALAPGRKFKPERSSSVMAQDVPGGGSPGSRRDLCRQPGWGGERLCRREGRATSLPAVSECLLVPRVPLEMPAALPPHVLLPGGGDLVPAGQSHQAQL
ncbi:hypothetical protein NDU88_001424 [Pleurodeles waltl]|uniref:Uncharacterized protein n=1 Tax=Pleurodeles waltl TaxID=8319 RepID=A0AAV7MLG3_PLEWA|nr:hypothetical protein NDU88_001424 [Pleurodeles waltl]